MNALARTIGGYHNALVGGKMTFDQVTVSNPNLDLWSLLQESRRLASKQEIRSGKIQTLILIALII